MMPRLRRLIAGLLFGIASMAQAVDQLPAREIAPGVFVIPAPIADAGPENGGRVVNTGFIVGATGVAVIDSGANHRHGQAILATVRSHTTRPIAYLINSHPHPQNVLGNAAFAEAGIPILATPATRKAMAERCPTCLKNLADTVGESAMTGTRIVLPEQTVHHEDRLDLGGRTLRFIHTGQGHTEGDLAVLDEATGTLFAGDLVYRGQIPHLAEADTAGWLAALEILATLPVRQLVPGRGPVGHAADARPIARYLHALRTAVAASYARGGSATDAINAAAQPEFADWHGYADRHGRNVQHVYFELEREDFSRETTP